MVTMTSVQMSGTGSPGATSHNTGSFTPTNGNGYLIAVTRIDNPSDPSDATVSGWGGQTFTELTSLGLIWSPTGSTRRRTQFFKCFVASGSTGALTISYATTPDTLDWAIIDLGVTSPNVVVAGSEKVTSASITIAVDTLTENLTMNAVASSKNRWLCFGAINGNATTFRLELDADTGGDQDWITVASFGSTSSRARKTCWGYRDANNDTTPGCISSTGGLAFFSAAIEIEYAITYEATMSSTPTLGGAIIAAVVQKEASLSSTPSLGGAGVSAVVIKEATMSSTPNLGGATLNGTVNGGSSGKPPRLNPWLGDWIGL